MWTANNWKDYEVIDTGSGEKLERWGKYLLVRPDPQVITEAAGAAGSGSFLIFLRNGASITGISPSGSNLSASSIPACFRNRLSTGTGFPISSQTRGVR